MKIDFYKGFLMSLSLKIFKYYYFFYYFMKDQGVSAIVGEILIISITFILTILVLHYGIMSLTGIQSGNIYINGYVQNSGNNITVTITSGSVPLPFSLEIIRGSNVSLVNINNFQKNFYNATLGKINFTISIEKNINSDKLTAGDSIIIRNIPYSYIAGSVFNIIYDNRIVFHTTFQ